MVATIGTNIKPDAFGANELQSRRLVTATDCSCSGRIFYIQSIRIYWEGITEISQKYNLGRKTIENGYVSLFVAKSFFKTTIQKFLLLIIRAELSE